ncbi:TPA: hypothetical protein ACVB6Z_000547 [Acinetobacter baumannii]|nr:hypothetical protein [Acinetobacter baumannii]
MSRLLVHRFSSLDTGTEKGYVVPIAKENDDGTIEPTIREDFPNDNRVWISKEFGLIENNYAPTEIFYLNSYHESSERIDSILGSTNANICKYFSLGSNASRVDRNGYMQMIKLQELPDIRSGRIKSNIPINLPPFGTPFFINVDDFVYGPFHARKESDIQDDIVFETVNKATPLGLQNNHIAKFRFDDLVKSNVLLTVKNIHFFGQYISNLHIVKKINSYEVLDYISDSNLVAFFLRGDFGKDAKTPLSKSHASTLKSAIDDNIKKKNLTSNNNKRVERVFGILDQFLSDDSQDFEVIKNYLRTKDGIDFLNDYVSRNEKQLLEEKLKDFSEKNEKELSVLRQAHDSQIVTLNQKYATEKQTIDLKIAKLFSELEEAQQQTQEERKKLNSSALNAEVESLEAKLEELKIEYKKYQSLAEVEKAIEKAKLKKEIYDEELVKIKDDVTATTKALHQQKNLLESPALLDNVVNHYTITQLLDSKKIKVVHEPVELAFLPKACINVVGETRISYIKYLQNEINGNFERQLSYSDTANLLVSVLQSYITILNGNPGIGKTSTVRNFAAALGLLSPDPGKIGNFLNVPVGRGWTSKRNLLGFMNPVEHIYNPADTGIYNLLKALNENKNTQESENINHEFLSLILLDEANLSSMEHYWADFLSICDTFQEGSMINLGGIKREMLELPQSLRFIGTINNDATVEALSDRLLDRASIITLNHNDVANNGVTPLSLMQDELFNGAVTYKELANAFIADSTANLSDSVENDSSLISQISNILSTEIPNCSSITISPRKLKAIYSYLVVANELDYQQVAPIDYAIAQHIIPKIKGYGKSFKNRLLELEALLSTSHLTHSRRLIKQIMENGGDFGDTFSLL